jgi:hypothetical protein
MKALILSSVPYVVSHLMSFSSWISDALPLFDKIFQHNVTTKTLHTKQMNTSVSYRTGLAVVVALVWRA